jgi:sRNA-binding protein
MMMSDAELTMEKSQREDTGPILATELEVRRAEAIIEMLVRTIDILPSEPGDPVRPFAIGLFDEIRGLLKPDRTVSKLRRVTSGYVHSKRYYLACARPDAERFDLAGVAVGKVSEADRESALQSLVALQSAHAKPTTAPTQEDRASRIRGGLLPRKRE